MPYGPGTYGKTRGRPPKKGLKRKRVAKWSLMKRQGKVRNFTK